MRGSRSVFILFICFFYVFLLFNDDCLFAQSNVLGDSPFGAHTGTPYEEANRLGVTWTRSVYFLWAAVDPGKTGDPNKFQWKGFIQDRDGLKPFDYDIVIKEENDHGLQAIHNIDVQAIGVPNTHRVPGSWLPVNEVAYKNFVKTVVKRYPSIKYYQVGNEPNNVREYAPSSFAKLQQITYEAIKEANPQAQVLIAGLAEDIGTIYTQGSWYAQILPLLQGKYIDIYDIHFYGDAKNGMLIPDGGQYSSGAGYGYGDFKKVHQYYRSLLDRYGFSSVPIWSTEMGTFSGTIKIGQYSFTQTETEQAKDLIRRHVYPLSLGARKIFWAMAFLDGEMTSSGYDYFDHTGLIYGKDDGVHKYGEKKLGYYTYKLMTGKLEGSDWKNIKTLVSTNGIYLFKFYRAGKPVWVAWNDNASERQVIVPGIMTPKIKVTEMVPKYNSGREVPTTGEIFKVTNQAVKSSISAVLLKRNPVVIEESM